MLAITDRLALDAAVRQAVADTRAIDIHTHLFPPAHGEQLAWGIDELLTYHYLLAELFTATGIEPAGFFRLPRPRRAEIVFEELFIKRTPISESTRGVLMVLERLGMDVAGRDLAAIRRGFDGIRAEEYVDRILDLAGLDYAVMTNDPFEPAEADAWRRKLPAPPRLKTALRIDQMINHWPAACKQMADQGYAAGDDAAGMAAARKFLNDWADRLGPLYLAASMPGTFNYGDNQTSRVIDEVALPFARERGLALAMMIGVKRGVNPSFGQAGDGMGQSDVDSVARLAARNPDVKFLVTMLARADQQELAVAARKFANLHVFGCWWFCNQPSIIREITQMRVELLGTNFTANHSDARVVDQLIYKWATTRQVLADVLVEKFGALFDTGWRVSEQEIRRDTRRLLGGAFEEFLAR